MRAVRSKKTMQGDDKLPDKRLMFCQCFCVGITCMQPRMTAASGGPRRCSECETCVLPAVPTHDETQLAILFVFPVRFAAIEHT